MSGLVAVAALWLFCRELEWVTDRVGRWADSLFRCDECGLPLEPGPLGGHCPDCELIRAMRETRQ